MRYALIPLLAALAGAPAAAQQLLDPTGWLRIEPQRQLEYKVTATEIFFKAYCGSGSCQNLRTGVYQIFDVPRAGMYQLRFRGDGGGTGTFQTRVNIAGNVRTFTRENWHLAMTVMLPPGRNSVILTTNTSNLKDDHWRCAQPTLDLVVGPPVDIDVGDAGRPSDVVVKIETPGLLVAGSLKSLASPIRIPGLDFGLLLSPNEGFLLGSGASGVTLDLSRAASNLGLNVWPKIYLQAVSQTSFGPLGWL